MLKIVDSHVHFWRPELLRYSWLDDIPTLNRPFLPVDLPQQGDDWITEKVVFVQADCLPEQGVSEAAWVASLAQDGAPIAGIVAFAPLELGNGARAVLEQLQTFPLIKGVRRLIQSEPLGFCVHPAFVTGVQLLANFGYSFDICVRHYQLPDVLTLVSACPDVKFVLDHIGKPDIKTGQLDPWRDHVRQLAAFPNVECKLSGLVTEADMENWQPEDLAPYIDHVLNCFGIGRVMFGSDFPVMRLAADYNEWIDVLLDVGSDFSSNERAQLFYGNAHRFYRL
jgi:L-fuconolactonase